MSKDKSKIQNETAYFNKVIKNMDRDDYEKQNKIEDHEIILERREYENLGDDLGCEKQLYNQQFLGWIELLENTKLYEAVKSLPVEDQIFISYIIKEKRTQREMAQLYKIDQRTVGRHFDKISKKIKKFYTKKRI